MIQFVDRDGRTFEFDEEKFPIKVIPTCESLIDDRRLYINWTYINVNGERTKIIRSMNLGR